MCRACSSKAGVVVRLPRAEVARVAIQRYEAKSSRSGSLDLLQQPTTSICTVPLPSSWTTTAGRSSILPVFSLVRTGLCSLPSTTILYTQNRAAPGGENNFASEVSDQAPAGRTFDDRHGNLALRLMGRQYSSWFSLRNHPV